MPQSIDITGHDLLRYYHGLQGNYCFHLGLRDPADELNELAGRLYSSETWLEILDPYYQSIINPGSESSNV